MLIVLSHYIKQMYFIFLRDAGSQSGIKVCISHEMWGLCQVLGTEGGMHVFYFWEVSHALL